MVNDAPVKLTIDISGIEAQIQSIVNVNRDLSARHEELLEHFKTIDSRLENHVKKQIDSIFNAKYESDKEIQCNLKEIDKLERKKGTLKAEILEIRDELKDLKDIQGTECSG